MNITFEKQKSKPFMETIRFDNVFSCRDFKIDVVMDEYGRQYYKTSFSDGEEVYTEAYPTINPSK